MDFCTAHFGKTLNYLTIDDVKAYFTVERIESDQIEFKSIHPTGKINEKFTGIQRSVCAFLNSSGGLLIWGSPGSQKVDGKKIFKGELSFFNEVLEKDFVISKISDSIIPLPNNVRINILRDNNSSIMVLEIDASEYSPHQNANTYYMRIDGQTKPAPHHYIEALFKKITYPNIEAFLKVTHYNEIENNRCQLYFTIVFFNWSPLQNEEKLSLRVLSDNGIFSQTSYLGTGHNYTKNGHEYFKENIKDLFYYAEPLQVSNSLIFNSKNHPEYSNVSKLLISFGGKFSPRKTCHYTLDFNLVSSKEPNSVISNKLENILVKDFHDKKGMTKESIIKSTMRVI